MARGFVASAQDALYDELLAVRAHAGPIVVVPVFVVTEIPAVGWSPSPGSSEYGAFLARVGTLGRIHGGPSAVNQRQTRKSAGRDFPSDRGRVLY